MVRTHIRRMGGIAPGVPPQGAKTCFVFFCYQGNTAFRSLILHQFRPFLKKQTWTTLRMCTPVKDFRISAQGFFHIPKTADFGTVDSRVFVIELQVKRHNFPRWESFTG